MKEDDKFYADAPYVSVKALEKGVNIIGVTRGEVTKIHHTEKLDRNEVLIVQFTEHTSGIKIRGKAEIYTHYGSFRSSSSSPSSKVTQNLRSAFIFRFVFSSYIYTGVSPLYFSKMAVIHTRGISLPAACFSQRAAGGTAKTAG